jgi:hypothetical protein
MVTAQGFPPVVISSVVWLADRGVDIALVRFQPYQQADGQVFVAFSQLFPLLDLEKSLVSPGTPLAEVPTDLLPSIEWSTADLITLGRVANATTRTTLDLCSEHPGSYVSFTEIVDAAGVSRPVAKGQLAGLTVVVKRRFGRRNWPFTVKWDADGTQQASYVMTEEAAQRWQNAAIQLDIEQSDLASDDSATGTTAVDPDGRLG